MTELTDNRAAGRFELVEQGHTAFAEYRRVGGELMIDHVEAPVALRGTGASGRLMQAIVDQADQEGLTITPHCSYAADWLSRRQAKA